MSATIDLLRNYPQYTRLWLADAISLLGDWFNTIVLVALVSKNSEGSGLAVGGLLLARTLAPLLVSPYAGVLADRFDRKRIMIVSDLLRAVVVPGYLLAGDPDMLWLIYVLTALQFGLSALFYPARKAIIPGIIPSQELVRANTLSSITWSAMLAIGALIGGLIAALFGIMVALLIDAATFMVSALLISQITPPAMIAARGETAPDEEPPTRGFSDGIRFAAAHPEAGSALLIKLGEAVGDLNALMAIFATQVFVLGDNGEQSLGVLYAALGIGAVLGPIVFNRFNDGSIHVMRRLVSIGFAVMLLSWFLLGAAPNLALVALALAIHAVGGSANWTYSSVLIQKATPDAYLGRMFSLDTIGLRLIGVVSTILTGWLIDTVGIAHIQQIVIGIAFVSFIPLLVWTFITIWLKNRAAGGLIPASEQPL